MMRIAVKGGIAAGKSTVVNHLRSLGAFAIDYDVLAREWNFYRRCFSWFRSARSFVWTAFERKEVFFY